MKQQEREGSRPKPGTGHRGPTGRAVYLDYHSVIQSLKVFKQDCARISSLSLPSNMTFQVGVSGDLIEVTKPKDGL